MSSQVTIIEQLGWGGIQGIDQLLGKLVELLTTKRDEAPTKIGDAPNSLVAAWDYHCDVDG